jgi:hypothetical protein
MLLFLKLRLGTYSQVSWRAATVAENSTLDQWSTSGPPILDCPVPDASWTRPSTPDPSLVVATLLTSNNGPTQRKASYSTHMYKQKKKRKRRKNSGRYGNANTVHSLDGKYTRLSLTNNCHQATGFFAELSPVLAAMMLSQISSRSSFLL